MPDGSKTISDLVREAGYEVGVYGAGDYRREDDQAYYIKEILKEDNGLAIILDRIISKLND